MVEGTVEGITEKEFKAFIKVRDSGKTNMWDANAVSRLSKYVLDRDSVVAIITHWDKLTQAFPNADTRKKK